ncbi:MAG: IPT/TIG domain-containing protein [Pyrinomonadaceae bacterium MAG19_C2-C3]|nr:IPT/TIG domain-containing protein [Pyrinomonadaceae bacterium MAG19_C2-C3]
MAFTNTSTTRSSNTTVARYDGAIVCNAVGSATISAETYQRYFRDYACSQPYPLTASSTLTNNPSVSSITPARGLIGNTIQITINGDGFGATPKVNVPANGGITVSAVSAANGGTQVKATFAIAEDATGGNIAISVTAGGKTSNSKNFFVQIPSKLVRFNVPAVPNGLPGAPNGVGPLQTPVNAVAKDLSGRDLLNGQRVCGVYRNYAFVLVDQEGQRILQPFRIEENFSCFECPNGVPTFEPSDIPASGVISDTQLRARPGSNCLPDGDRERFLQGFTVVIGSKRFEPSTIVSIERGNFDGGLRVDSEIIAP